MEQEFTEFYLAARDNCLRVVMISTGDRGQAEDLVAEAFTRAWQSWAKIRGHPAREAWVVKTAINAGISSWRRRVREVPLDEHDLPGSTDSTGPGVGNPALMTAIRRLPRRQQQVLLLRVFFDLDMQLTADLLGIAPGTVGTHLHRALAALRSDDQTIARQELIP